MDSSRASFDRQITCKVSSEAPRPRPSIFRLKCICPILSTAHIHFRVSCLALILPNALILEKIIALWVLLRINFPAWAVGEVSVWSLSHLDRWHARRKARSPKCSQIRIYISATPPYKHTEIPATHPQVVSPLWKNILWFLFLAAMALSLLDIRG